MRPKSARERIDMTEAKRALYEMLVSAAAQGGTVTYSDVALGVFGGRVPARSRLIMDLLSEVDDEVYESEGVVIASLVVRADSGIPGQGYFTYLASRFGRDVSDERKAWLAEARRVWARFGGEPREDA